MITYISCNGIPVQINIIMGITLVYLVNEQMGDCLPVSHCVFVGL